MPWPPFQKKKKRRTSTAHAFWKKKRPRPPSGGQALRHSKKDFPRITATICIPAWRGGGEIVVLFVQKVVLAIWEVHWAGTAFPGREILQGCRRRRCLSEQKRGRVLESLNPARREAWRAHAESASLPSKKGGEDLPRTTGSVSVRESRPKPRRNGHPPSKKRDDDDQTQTLDKHHSIRKVKQLNR